MDKKARFNIWYAIAVLVGMVLVEYVIATARKIPPIPYSEFEQLLREGKVAKSASRTASSRAPSRSRCPTADAVRDHARRSRIRGGTAEVRRGHIRARSKARSSATSSPGSSGAAVLRAVDLSRAADGSAAGGPAG